MGKPIRVNGTDDPYLITIMLINLSIMNKNGLPLACPCNLSCSGSHSSIIKEVPPGGDSLYFSASLTTGWVKGDKVKGIAIKK